MNLSDFKKSAASSQPYLLLLGNPVAHSLSPLMHNRAANLLGMDLKYHAVRLEADELNSLSSLFNSPQFRGANVTIPYKESLLPFIDEVDDRAKQIGAINTIAREGNSLRAYNTDVFGFQEPLQPWQEELETSKAVVFGTGGASRAIVNALDSMGLSEIVIISRSPASRSGFDHPKVRLADYSNWAAMAEGASLIVNATPLGMEPDTDSSPVRAGEEDVLRDAICYDIVYKPLKTKFLRQAEKAGARTIGGLEMLMHQGSRSFEIWTGSAFPLDEIRNYLSEILEE